MNVSRHCATCEYWDDSDANNTLEGFCPKKGVTFLIDGCEDWDEAEDIPGTCKTCEQEIY